MITLSITLALVLYILVGQSTFVVSVAPEPAQALVLPSSIAALSDDRVAVLLPGGKQRLLLISRDAHPITLGDFSEPLVLFGEGGALDAQSPDGVAMDAGGNDLHVVCGHGSQLLWYTTACPISRNSNWRKIASNLAGKVTVEQSIDNSSGEVFVLYRESGEASQPRNRLGVATLRDGKIVTFMVTENDDAILSPRGAVGADAHLLEIVWTESESTPGICSARLDTTSGQVSQPNRLSKGRHPDVLHVDQHTFTVSEQTDGSILAEWADPQGSRGIQQLRGRASFGPTLLADEHGVAWLVAVGGDRRAIYYRRFLGDGFGSECECNAAPGAWMLSNSFAARALISPSRASVALLEAKFVEVTGEYRYVFANIPVPRYAVSDSRHVLFLDMLEVDQIQNLQQKVPTAVRSEANPLKLNGSPGWYDCAYAGYANVMVEGDKFRMWYNGRSDEMTADRKFVMCYAESTDGVSWTKPQLDLHEYKGSKQNNLIFPYASSACEPIVIRDDQEPDAARRYKMVLESTYEGATSVYLSWSADGIVWHWPPHRLYGKSPGKNQAGKGLHPWEEPLLSFFRDPLEKNEAYRWKIYGQNNYAGSPHPDPNHPRNLSLVHGATPYDVAGYVENPVLDPRTGFEEDQIHGGLVQPYEGMYVCLYQHWWGKDWKVDLRLAASRDGIHFVRVQPQTPVLPLGTDGAWDSGMLCTPNFLFERDGKLWLYYRGSVGTLATGMAIGKSKDLSQVETKDSWRMMTGLAKLRVDGFAFLTLAPMQYLEQPPRFTGVPDYKVLTLGTVRTIPIDAAGIAWRTLHVNVENYAPSFAWLKAQIYDADSGQVIPGHTFGDCDPVSDGSLDHRISWRGSPSLDGVGAQRIRVEFQFHGALDAPQLYSFWFADG